MIVCHEHSPAGNNCKFAKDHNEVDCPYCIIEQDEEILLRCFNKLTGIDADEWGTLRTILYERLRDII
jgi:hypothetical protein